MEMYINWEKNPAMVIFGKEKNFLSLRYKLEVDGFSVNGPLCYTNLPAQNERNPPHEIVINNPGEGISKCF